MLQLINKETEIKKKKNYQVSNIAKIILEHFYFTQEKKNTILQNS